MGPCHLGKLTVKWHKTCFVQKLNLSENLEINDPVALEILAHIHTLTICHFTKEIRWPNGIFNLHLCKG